MSTLNYFQAKPQLKSISSQTKFEVALFPSWSSQPTNPSRTHPATHRKQKITHDYFKIIQDYFKEASRLIQD